MTTYHRPFNAKRTLYNDRYYSSKIEARRAGELDLLLKAGKVVWWIPQVTVALGFPENRYRIDFLVAEPMLVDSMVLGITVHAEDVKSIETREFARHKRLWAKYGPFPLHVIKQGNVEIISPGEEPKQETTR